MQTQDLLIRALRTRIQKLNANIEALELENTDLKTRLEHCTAIKTPDPSLQDQLDAVLTENERLTKELENLKAQPAEKPTTSKASKKAKPVVS